MVCHFESKLMNYEDTKSTFFCILGWSNKADFYIIIIIVFKSYFLFIRLASTPPPPFSPAPSLLPSTLELQRSSKGPPSLPPSLSLHPPPSDCDILFPTFHFHTSVICKSKLKYFCLCCLIDLKHRIYK